MKRFEQSLPMMLLRAREATMSNFRSVLKASGLTEQQWRILRILNDSGEMESGLIAKKGCILKPSLTGILTRMEEDGLLERRRSKQDARRLHVGISEKGRCLIQDLTPLIEERYSVIQKKIGLEKLEQLQLILEQISQLHIDRV
jgi:homoprotocatechuate degradation regulator HpaR